jgi:hypothetical protein
MRAGRETSPTGWTVSLVAAGLSLAAAIVVIFYPLGRMVTVTPTTPGGRSPQPTVTSHSLFETEGWYIVGLAAIPVGISALVIPFRQGRLARVLRGIAGGLLLVFAVIGAFSIGLFFVPAAAAMCVAALL